MFRYCQTILVIFFLYGCSASIKVTGSSARFGAGKVPLIEAESVEFEDTDPDAGEVAGTITISRAIDETKITQYAIYWGTDAATKNGEAIVQLAATEPELTYLIPENTSLGTNTHFLIFTSNPAGEMLTGISVAISDLTDVEVPPVQPNPTPLTWITTFGSQSINEDAALDLILKVSGGTPAGAVVYSLDNISSCSKGAWSPQISVDAKTGKLAGTPTNADVGSCVITVKATAGTETISGNLTMVISNVNDAPVWSTPAGNLTHTEDVPLTLQVTATDEDAGSSISYALDLANMNCDNGAWSPNISVNSASGSITGTPTNDDVGTCTVKLLATSGADVIVREFTITVLNANDVPTWNSTISNTFAISNTTALSLTASANEVDVADTVVYSFDSAAMTCDEKTWSPALTIGGGTGAIAGTVTAVTAVETCTIVVKATSGPDTITQSFVLTLYPVFPAGFSCDSGSATTTCYVNSLKTLAAGNLVAAPGNLIIQSGGHIASNAEETIAIYFAGDITLENAGKIRANLSELYTTNLSIQGGAPGGVIDASGLGKPGSTNYLVVGSGTGGGESSPNGNGASGGAYGGRNGRGNSNQALVSTYGSNTNPVDLGSGGGAAGTGNVAGGDGGGAVKIVVTNTLTVEGSILVEGKNGSNGSNSGGFEGGGGGSGGSLWVVAPSVAGAGKISVKGGNGGDDGVSTVCGAGGSGGRLAFYTPTGFNFQGSLTVAGGVRGCARINAEDGERGTHYMSGVFHKNFLCDFGDDLDGATCTLSSVRLLPDNKLLLVGAGDLTINTTGSIIGPNVDLSVANLQIAAGGKIVTDGFGESGSRLTSVAGVGTGGGQSSILDGGSGAAHSGLGGVGDSGTPVSNNTYGNKQTPVLPGSGGGAGGGHTSGGSGGGIVRITVASTADINGIISANGQTGKAGDNSGIDGAGGGSGGSVLVTSAIFRGTGSVTANGGAGGADGASTACGGGAGGGRVSITSPILQFKGQTSAIGGAKGCTSVGVIGGTDGSIYISTTNFCDSGSLDDTCVVGAFKNLGTEPLVFSGSGLLDVQAAAILMGNLNITAGSVVLGVGSKIIATGLGSLGGVYLTSGSGVGGGIGGNSGAGGGGHGGAGGTGNSLAGGSAFGNAVDPTTFGAGGGGSDIVVGGNGGGAIIFSVTNTITIDGTIESEGLIGLNGDNSAKDGSGGGAGGTIAINAGTILGSGLMLANGGNGGTDGASAACGGGGGGGRIYLKSTVNNFFPIGNVSAAGGLQGCVNAANGQNGSITYDP